MSAMSLFRLKKTGGPRELELSMAGLKLGKSVLQVYGGDHDLITALAKVVGLSGQAYAVAETQRDAEAFERKAADAGVLVDIKVGELAALPYNDDWFDLVVIKHVLGGLTQNDRVLCLQQALRVLKAGGRCLVVDPTMRGGLGAVLSRRSLDPRYVESGGAQRALKDEGFLGIRLLAERDGLTFVEGAKLAGLDKAVSTQT
jgi:ubiquinone/menaquinone biosynthesis C-methylase UbiE